jgi:hypothetical protein
MTPHDDAGVRASGAVEALRAAMCSAFWHTDEELNEQARHEALTRLDTLAAALERVERERDDAREAYQDARFECGCWLSEVGCQRHPAIIGGMCCPVHLKPYGENPKRRPRPARDSNEETAGPSAEEKLATMPNPALVLLRDEVNMERKRARDFAEEAERLRPYVQHKTKCILNISRSPLRETSWCDCGLTEALASPAAEAERQ